MIHSKDLFTKSFSALQLPELISSQTICHSVHDSALRFIFTYWGTVRSRTIVHNHFRETNANTNKEHCWSIMATWPLLHCCRCFAAVLLLHRWSAVAALLLLLWRPGSTFGQPASRYWPCVPLPCVCVWGGGFNLCRTLRAFKDCLPLCAFECAWLSLKTICQGLV